MNMINSWHCDNLYNTDEPPLMIEQTCTVTSSSTPPAVLGDSPITVRDDGTMIFGLGIIIFFLAVFFFATLFGALGMKSKL